MIVLRQPACKVTLRRNLERSQLTQCVVIAGMLGDILSMDIYRLSDRRAAAFRWNDKRCLRKWVGCKRAISYMYSVRPVERYLRYLYLVSRYNNSLQSELIFTLL